MVVRRHLRFADDVLDVPAVDLPTIDPRFRGQPSRHMWLGEVITAPGKLAFWGCQHLDSSTGRLDRWLPDGGRRSGEWLFVPTARGHEGEGWVMVFVYDPRVQRSSLVVLEAQDVARGPVAEVHLPVRVPYGFHGAFLTV